jgi:hypothetical protein
MTKTERRDCERYVFDLPIHAAWKGAAGKVKEEIGITRDISSSGTFMICSNLIDRECKIDFRVDLPVLVKDAAKSCILGRGKVVRKVSLANPDTGYGHGIMFDNYKILRLNSIIYQFGTKGGIENVT